MESLHECKRALDAGLIAREDYDCAKDWFLFAHRISSARESGVLSPADVAHVRQALVEAIHSGARDVRCDVKALLDETLTTGATRGGDAGADAGVGSALKTKFNVKKSVAAQPTFMVKMAEKAEESNENVEPAVVEVKEIAKAPVAPAAPMVPPPVAPPPPPAPAAPATNGASTVEGKSMSGVAVAEDCISVFNKVKLRSSGLQWAVFRVEETEGSVLTDATGAAGDGDYSAFIAALPDNECRYAIYDYEYVNSEDCVFSKLVFIIWNPDGARLKNKMLYASTKDFFKSRLSGIAVEIQATDLDEVSEEELRANVGAILTRK